MPTAQPSLFEFSDGSKLKPIVKVERVAIHVDQSPDAVKLIATGVTRYPDPRCQHNPIKLNTRLHPDLDYWCTRCGGDGLPAPEKKP